VVIADTTACHHTTIAIALIGYPTSSVEQRNPKPIGYPSRESLRLCLGASLTSPSYSYMPLIGKCAQASVKIPTECPATRIAAQPV
jgi:hypothetical protein